MRWFYKPLEGMVTNLYRWRTKWRNRHWVWFYRCLENMQTHYAVFNPKNKGGPIDFVDAHGEVFDSLKYLWAGEDREDILVGNGFTKITTDDELISLIGCPQDIHFDYSKPDNPIYSDGGQGNAIPGLTQSASLGSTPKDSDEGEPFMQKFLGFMFDQTDRFLVFQQLHER